MGQKSSCCNISDPPLQTEIDTTEPQDAGIYTTSSDRRDVNTRGKKMASERDDDKSLAKSYSNNQILSKHMRHISQSSNDNKSSSDITLRVKQLTEIVHYAPILKLKVISSSTLPKGHTITINAQGVENSCRNKKDGATYFGCKKRLKRVSKHVRQTEIINDYILPSVSAEIAKKHRGQHFQIEYHTPSNSYRIKDLGVGFGTFYKLDFPLVLKENHLLNMGMVFMVVNFLANEKNGESARDNTKESSHTGESRKTNGPLLSLKFFGGPCNGDIKVIEPGEGTVQIGRRGDCDIQIDENLLSKFQCNIEFSQSIGWVLRDGKDKRPSTNGTWLYIGEDQTLYNGMVFKANQTLFQVSLM